MHFGNCIHPCTITQNKTENISITPQVLSCPLRVNSLPPTLEQLFSDFYHHRLVFICTRISYKWNSGTMYAFVSGFLLNMFLEIHHIITCIGSLFFFIQKLVMNWVLNEGFDREKAISIIGKENALGQRLQTLCKWLVVHSGYSTKFMMGISGIWSWTVKMEADSGEYPPMWQTTENF